MLCSDGYNSHNRSKIYLGHPIDLENIIRDIEDIEKDSVSIRKENYGWGITLLGKLGKMFRNLPGMLLGKKVNQTRTLPTILEYATKTELRAFLSGLFGGDGHTFSYSEKSGSIGSVSLSWTSRKPEQLEDVFTKLQTYFTKCDISTSITRHGEETNIHIKTEDILKFKETIGFSYCVHKSMRLEVGYSYYKMRHEVWEQQKWLVSRVKTLKKVMIIEKANEKAQQELKDSFPIYNDYYSSPSKSQMIEMMRPTKKWDKPMFSHGHFPNPLEYFDDIGATNLFESYSVDIDNNVIPCIYKKVIKIENIGKQQVYDLEVDSSHSFVANGVVVHNCEHDPKIIRVNNLTNYIKIEEENIKKIRLKRDKTVDKLRKKELQEEVNKLVNELKPYKKERSEINKTKPKNIMCDKRSYRFIKEPKGILPTIIQNLLDARNHTRKVDMICKKDRIKELLKLQEKTGEDMSIQIKECESILGVLDKRQLAYKVSANSMYGAMGVRRGYLPFMPGAMCTTYMGRKNIELVAKTITEKHGGELIYGDTDTVLATTPVLILQNNVKYYTTLENLSAGDWKKTVTGKEISSPKDGIKVWSDKGFTEIKYVMRHAIEKPLIKVTTHTGTIVCTLDHSLLWENGKPALGSEIKLKDKLCHRCLPLPDDTPEEPVYTNKLTAEKIREYKISNDVYENLSAELAFVWGVFFADGSCGAYQQKTGVNYRYSWAINKKDNILLERCLDILILYEPTLSFKILDTMKSSHVNKLVPCINKDLLKEDRGVIKDFVEKYRDLFYDNRKYKKVPDIILNAPYSIREAFFMGYYAGDGSKKDPSLTITNKGEIGCAGLFFLLRSIGYQVSINTRGDKPDTYKLTGSTPMQKFRYHPNAVKKIESYQTEDEYIYDIETGNHHFAAGIGQMVVHNSNYIYFPHKKDSSSIELWDYAEEVADKVTRLFPPPVKLEFEEAIYDFFFILTKKRYMYRAINSREGEVDKKIGKKGVLLARRDNSKFVRDIYEGVITKIADCVARDDILYWTLQEINAMFSGNKPYTDFVITKSVGNCNNCQEEIFINEKGEKKGKVGDYTTPILSSNPEERKEQMKKKGATTVNEFYLLCLPAQVQLAEKMKRRGQRVDSGSRLEYLVTDPVNHTSKQYEKIESSEYYKKFSTIIKIDYFYYLKALSNPLDQVLNVAYGKDKDWVNDFILNLYNFKYKVEYKNILNLKEIFNTKFTFEK